MRGTAAAIITWLNKRMAEKPDCIYEVKVWKKRRSLDANAYFHVLCDKLRMALGMSMARCKNHLIADYGQALYGRDGGIVYVKTNWRPEDVAELESLHMAPVGSEPGKRGEIHIYRVYRGSHTYDSAEMARLIDGAAQECRQQDIETIPPKELAAMMRAWKRKKGGGRGLQEQAEPGD